MIFACFALLFLQYESLLSSLKAFLSSFTFICLATHLLFMWLPDCDHAASGNRSPLRSSSFDSETQQTSVRNRSCKKGIGNIPVCGAIIISSVKKFFVCCCIGKCQVSMHLPNPFRLAGRSVLMSRNGLSEQILGGVNL